MIQQTQEFFSRPIQLWLEAHPIVAWAIDHPLLALGILVLLVLLLGGLLKAIARLTEQVWFALLQVPLRFGRWLLRSIAKSFQPTRQPPIAVSPLVAASQSVSQQERLQFILLKLETMRQEQDQLLREVAAMLTKHDSAL